VEDKKKRPENYYSIRNRRTLLESNILEKEKGKLLDTGPER